MYLEEGSILKTKQKEKEKNGKTGVTYACGKGRMLPRRSQAEE